MLNKLMGRGGPAAPSEAEMAAMQEELGKLDPKALEQLPKDLQEALPKGLSGLGGVMPKLPGLRRRPAGPRRRPPEIPRCAGAEEIEAQLEMKEDLRCP